MSGRVESEKSVNTCTVLTSVQIWMVTICSPPSQKNYRVPGIPFPFLSNDWWTSIKLLTTAFQAKIHPFPFETSSYIVFQKSNINKKDSLRSGFSKEAVTRILNHFTNAQGGLFKYSYSIFHCLKVLEIQIFYFTNFRFLNFRIFEQSYFSIF